MIVNGNSFVINALKDATPIMGGEYYNKLRTLLQEREKESQRFNFFRAIDTPTVEACGFSSYI